MTQQSGDLRSLLTAADEQFQPGRLGPSARRITIEGLQQRRRRIRTRCVVTVSGLLLCATVFGAWLRTGPDRVPSARATAAPTDSGSFERRLAQLELDASAAAGAGKAWQHELRRESLLAEYRQLRRDAVLAELRSPIERAAQLNLNMARELERQFGQDHVSIAEYRRIVEQFPGTSSARLAEERLAHTN